MMMKILKMSKSKSKTEATGGRALNPEPPVIEMTAVRGICASLYKTKGKWQDSQNGGTIMPKTSIKDPFYLIIIDDDNNIFNVLVLVVGLI